MKPLKEIVGALCRFSSEERLAVAVLAAVVVGIVAIRLISSRPLGSRVDVKIDSKADSVYKTTDSLFRFDPNTVTVNELQLLGFSAKQAQAIDNYRRAGAKFSTPQDFGRSFVVSDSMLRRLTPYMVFTTQKAVSPKDNKGVAESDEKTGINKADSVALCSINGIGKILSHRILDYRHRLGGFANFDQLHEIYGINEQIICEIKKKFFVDSAEIQKIDINFASGKILSKHPYMNSYTVGRVLKIREMKGGWNNIAEMKNDETLLPDEAQLLEPYLVFRREKCDSNQNSNCPNN